MHCTGVKGTSILAAQLHNIYRFFFGGGFLVNSRGYQLPHWADSVIESSCLSVCVCACVCVCAIWCSFFQASHSPSGYMQCSQNLMRVRFCKNAGIMRVYFLLKCGYYAGIKSQKCGYISEKIRELCGYFKRCDTFSSLFYVYKTVLFPLHL